MSQPLWVEFDSLVKRVRKDHELARETAGGHDFYHALMVAQYAVMIAPDTAIGRLAWLAGLCHNTDRLFPDKDDESIRTHVENEYLLINGDFPFDSHDREIVVTAVMEHSKLNSDSDGPVTITLKDADRLANIGPALVIRAGQHYHNLPCFDPRWVEADDPRANYHNPGTVLRDVREVMVWEDWLRLPKARELAIPYFDFLRQYVALFAQQVHETGLSDLPPQLLP